MKKILVKLIFAGVLLATVFCIAPTTVFAQAAADPKSFYPVEPGTDLIILYYRYISADTYYSHDRALPDNKYKYNYSNIRLAHYGTIFGLATVGTGGLTFGDKSIEGSITGGVRSKASGVGDLNYKQFLWLINNDTWKMAVVGGITAPVGEYDGNKLVNMGANRWMYHAEGGIGYIFLNRCMFELHEAATIYAPNNDYTNISHSHQRLTTDPLYNTTMQLHYDVNQYMYLTGATYWLRGGDNQLNGVQQYDDINTFGGMLSVQLHYGLFQMFIQYGKDFEVKNGFKTDAIQFRLRYGY